MADTKVSALASTTPATEDFVYLVDDPSGTPASAKATLDAVLALIEIVDDTTPQLGGTLDGNSNAISGVTTLGLAGDITDYEATNDGNPELRLGSADAEELHIQAVYDGGAQTLDYVLFQTDAASATADKGKFTFNVDGTAIADIDDDGLHLGNAKSVTFPDSDGSHATVLKANDTTTSAVTYTLPAADGSNTNVLRTSGAGVMSWGAVAINELSDAELDGSDNLFIGATAPGTLSGATDNLAISGDGLALSAITSGDENLAWGDSAANTLTTGSRNIVAGVDADVDSAARNDTVVIGDALTSGASDGSIALGSSTVATNVLRVDSAILTVGGNQLKQDVESVSDMGATETISWAKGIYIGTMTENCAITFSNAEDGMSLAMVIQGAFTPSFTDTVLWPDDTEPTYADATAYTFTRINGAYYGEVGVHSTNDLLADTNTPGADPGWTTSSTVNMNAPNGYLQFDVAGTSVATPYWNV